MKTESQEFTELREGAYAAASVGVEPVGRDTPDVDERDTWQLWKCLCCGERKRIRPGAHVCEECETNE